jgi:NitT/TauT family transport system substrate-binding protein
MVRFARAYTKAQIACVANPEFCVKAFWRANPQSKPSGDEAQALKDQATLLSRRLQRVLYTPSGQPRVPGYYDLNAIKAGIQAMASAGEYPSANVPVDQIFSNQFIKQINDFDADAVRAQAKAAK